MTVAANGVAATSSFHNNPRQIVKQAEHNSVVATQLQAANELIKQHHYYLAGNLLRQIIGPDVTPADVARKKILFAKIGLLQNRPGDSLNALNQITQPEQLSNKLQIHIYKMRAAALLQLGQVVNNIKIRIQMQPLLDQTAQKNNAITIWKQMQRLSISGLQDLRQDKSQTILAGWADLALIVRQYDATNAQQLSQQLQVWRQTYPQHPATILLPTSFDSNQISNQSIKHVALLLPLHGPFKNQAEAVMNGFFATYHQRSKTQQPNIKIYDTSKPDTNITTIYNQAVSDGAQFIVGPLTKTNVQTMTNNGSCAVTTLFLNYTQVDGSLPSNCYEFGISPIDEASQAATRAWLGNYDHAVILSPKGAWGQAIANSFNNQWQLLGGRTVAELPVDPQQSLAKQISTLMGVEQSNARAKAIRRLLLQTVKFLPRRRKDIGVIFINATNAQARQLVPLLKFNFTGQIPIFATSLIYDGIPQPQTDRDLNGVRFLIMPWSINPTPSQKILRDQLQRLWPTNFRNNSKLYGLGIDSLHLMHEIQSMQLFPQITVAGVTGTLTLQSTQQITQTMLWAQFVRGKPTLLAQKNKALYGE